MEETFIDQLEDKSGLIVAEVGVFKADNAQRLFDELNVAGMYLIDPYVNYDEYTGIRQNTNELENAREIARKKLREYPTNFVEEFSHEASQYIDRKLDLAYIDGNHEYEYAKRDMEVYWELLRAGGILAGHDIDRRGVSKAFQEFCVERDLQSHIDKHSSEWYVVKQ